MTPGSRWGIVGKCLGLTLLLGGTATAQDIVRQVNCRNQSIQAFLDGIGRVDSIRLEIRGRCQEAVEIRRDNVSLVGADPRDDAIVGPASGSRAVVSLRQAANVVIQNLRIGRGATFGLLAVDAQDVTIDGCRFAGNGRTGAAFLAGSTATINRSSFVNNTQFGVYASGSQVILEDENTLRGNSFAQALSTMDATIELSEAGNTVEVGGAVAALAAVQGGFLRVQSNTSIDGSGGVAFWATERGHIDLSLVEFSGDVVVAQKSLATFWRVTQVAPGPGGNRIAGGSTVSSQESHLLGTTSFDTFSNGFFKDSTAAENSFDMLVCTNGGDFACLGDPAPASNAGSTGCSLCP